VRRHLFAPPVTAAVAALALTACGSSSSGKPAAGGAPAAGAADNKLAGATFTVASKDFTESIVLGKITSDVLAAHGAKIVDKTNIKGSVSTRTALTSGQVDMYWEYTGTAWINYLKHSKPISDPQGQYTAVKTADAKNGLAWLPYAPMNDTYGLAIRKSQADKLNVHSLSDLGKLSKTSPKDATFCIESEFSTRDDGFPGVLKAYGITAPKSQVKLLDTGVVYTQTAKGDGCNFGEVFATDGRIAALNLEVLRDDTHFFPNYNAALTLKQTLLMKYPSIADYIDPVAKKLDDKTMTDLNAKVDKDGEDPADVAKTWLKDNGLISK